MVARAVAILAVAAFGQDYAGSRACTPCHSAIAARYAKSGMARSLSTAVPPLPDATIHSAALKRTFEVFTRAGRIWQRESGDGFKNEHELAFAIGSGANGISFAVRRGDHLFQAPLSWYSRTKSWDLSPGYEHADYAFNRPVAAGCIACHSARPRTVPLSSGRFLNPPFDEEAIGCETCHGPGKKHAATASRASIVNPARLPAERAEEICMRCHQGGDARVLMPGKSETDFRPGERLGDTLAIFQGPREADTDLLQHHEAMRASTCFQKSGTMTCHTCHNPHAAVQNPNANCLSCHTRLAAGHRNGNRDCVGCHMPKREIGVIAHSALTNHRISTRPFVERRTGLTLFNEAPPPSPAMLFQAYGQAMEKRPEYAALFRDYLAKAGEEPVAFATRGRAALRAARPAEALPLLKSAIDQGYRTAATFEDLADALAKLGRVEESLAVLQEGLRSAPFSQTMRKALALRHIQRKDYRAARETLETYVNLFPEDDFIRGLLRQVSGTP